MIRLIVDSSADYTKKELEDREIELIPLTISLGEENYLDGVNLTRNELYNWLTSGDNFPKTSQPSPQAFAEIFEDAKENGDEVICILLSSALSGTCQSAMIARDMVGYEKIHIVDSLSATHAIRILADYANRMRRNGSQARQIVTALEELKSKIKILAAVDTLEYLHRGGRLSKTAATVGTLVNLKPVITVTTEGTVSVVTKCMGKNKTLSYLINSFKELAVDTAFPIYSLYTYGEDNTIALEARLAENNITITDRLQVGATIGCHIGPGASGIVFVEK